VVIPANRQETALQPLPIEALRLAPEAANKLHLLDIRTIGRLQALPRETLPSRFGVEVLCRLDQALGQRPELFETIRPPPPVEATWDFLHPTTERWILETMLRQLIETLAATVAEKNRGIRELHCRFVGEQRSETCLTVRLLRPTAAAPRLFELLRLRLDSTRLTTDVYRLHLQAEVAPLEVCRYSLFDDVDQIDRQRELTLLIERLGNRLGSGAIDRPQPSLNPQPEFAIAYVPALTAEDKKKEARKKEKGKRKKEKDTRLDVPRVNEATAPFRPSRLAREPIPVDAVSAHPDGPPARFFWQNRTCQVARCWGPERIETGWWRGQHVRRDYFRVETTAGLRFWLFRQTDDGRWYLHGVFG
jgi:protein ImuB